MSFSDMMSSARGPGVIGMMLALVVLIGFGVLFMFAFDEGFQGGGPTIESEIASQATVIENTRVALAKGEEKLALAPGRKSLIRELGRVKGRLELQQEKIADTKEDVETIKEDIVAMGEEWESYKDQYREFVRGQAKGTELETLETRDGKIYKEVSIREVTAIGMQIRHSDGFKRITFEELSDELQDFYQFSPEQKEKALAEELAIRNQHNQAAAVANRLADEKMAEQRAKNDAETKAKIRRSISVKEAQIAAAMRDIEGFERDKVQADAAAAAARAAGRMHLSKSGSINSRIRSKRNQIATLSAEITRLKAQL